MPGPDGECFYCGGFYSREGECLVWIGLSTDALDMSGFDDQSLVWISKRLLIAISNRRKFVCN